ncbi:hypothetical protein ACOSP7_009338 [Xanthoceras sorbifolium]
MRDYNPEILFLSETLSSVSQLERLRLKLGLCGKLVVDRVGHKGGLGLLWSNNVSISLVSFSNFHIDVQVGSQDNKIWHFSGFYGNPEASQRSHGWTLLRRLNSDSSLPWLCGGDFNEILFPNEKDGGVERARHLINNFRRCLDDCELHDLGFTGPPFTWCNGRQTADFIQARLDRFVCDSGWRQFFPFTTVHHLDFWGSDHRPILMDTLGASSHDRGTNPRDSKRFMFEEFWIESAECGNIILEQWRALHGNSLGDFQNFLAMCSVKLHEWNNSTFKSLRHRIAVKKKELHALNRDVHSGNWRNIIEMEKQLEALLYKEERYWQQRSRVSWLRHGDRNTRFFHSKATSRQRRNRINGLLDDNNILQNSDIKLAEMIQSYFAGMFQTSNIDFEVIDKVVQTVERRVSTSINCVLDAPFVADEVRRAIFAMHPTKAPGKDGMPAIFYQKYWETVGPSVTAACLQFLNFGGDIAAINSTIIVLIPKVKNPQRVSDYRPISLCNVFYKIISKVLSNRFRLVLGEVISEAQSAFLPGRLITDNAIIGFECLHELKRRR